VAGGDDTTRPHRQDLVGNLILHLSRNMYFKIPFEHYVITYLGPGLNGLKWEPMAWYFFPTVDTSGLRCPSGSAYFGSTYVYEIDPSVHSSKELSVFTNQRGELIFLDGPQSDKF
jgi:hypothetical protein